MDMQLRKKLDILLEQIEEIENDLADIRSSVESLVEEAYDDGMENGSEGASDA